MKRKQLLVGASAVLLAFSLASCGEKAMPWNEILAEASAALGVEVSGVPEAVGYTEVVTKKVEKTLSVKLTYAEDYAVSTYTALLEGANFVVEQLPQARDSYTHRAGNKALGLTVLCGAKEKVLSLLISTYQINMDEALRQIEAAHEGYDLSIIKSIPGVESVSVSTANNVDTIKVAGPGIGGEEAFEDYIDSLLEEGAVIESKVDYELNVVLYYTIRNKKMNAKVEIENLNAAEIELRVKADSYYTFAEAVARMEIFLNGETPSTELPEPVVADLQLYETIRTPEYKFGWVQVYGMTSAEIAAYKEDIVEAGYLQFNSSLDELVYAKSVTSKYCFTILDFTGGASGEKNGYMVIQFDGGAELYETVLYAEALEKAAEIFGMDLSAIPTAVLGELETAVIPYLQHYYVQLQLVGDYAAEAEAYALELTKAGFVEGYDHYGNTNLYDPTGSYYIQARYDNWSGGINVNIYHEKRAVIYVDWAHALSVASNYLDDAPLTSLVANPLKGAAEGGVIYGGEGAHQRIKSFGMSVDGVTKAEYEAWLAIYSEAAGLESGLNQGLREVQYADDGAYSVNITLPYGDAWNVEGATGKVRIVIRTLEKNTWLAKTYEESPISIINENVYREKMNASSPSDILPEWNGAATGFTVSGNNGSWGPEFDLLVKGTSEEAAAQYIEDLVNNGYVQDPYDWGDDTEFSNGIITVYFDGSVDSEGTAVISIEFYISSR